MLRFLSWLAVVGFFFTAVGAVGAFVIITYYSASLPDYSQLSKYEPPNTTRLYAGDGKLLKEYFVENRVFVPINVIPDRVKDAFIAAEDRNFFEHAGIDPQSILRAAVTNFRNYGQEKGLVGGSTITQQVVKNFLLGNEKSLERKVKEAILAFRVTKAYSKERILELYLNQIYLGRGSYGVAAAALNYFDKSIDELSVEEAALLASMPKAPAQFDPTKHYDRVKERRDWVIAGMLEQKFITAEEAKEATAKAITLKDRSDEEVAEADFFAEEVRRWMMEKYGYDNVYKGGYAVRTTVDPVLQKIADNALAEGLVAYDIKHFGYRGAVGKIDDFNDWKKKLSSYDRGLLPRGWGYGIVSEVLEQSAKILTDNGNGTIKLDDSKWALKSGESKLTSVLAKGDVIVIRPKPEEKEKADAADKKTEKKTEKIKEKDIYLLRQIPEVSGATVAMDPHTGRVLAMSGGFSYGKSEYNRATQAKRQPGSAFKPFVYLAALENGFGPTSIITDGPITLSQGAGMPAWSPQNYTNDFLGPVPLRVGVEKSRNAMTVRLAVALGLPRISEIGTRLGIYDDVPNNFSMVLGALETTVTRLTNAYSIVANGGLQVQPVMVERIQDRYGKTIYKWDNRECVGCNIEEASMTTPESPTLQDTRKRLIEEQVDYQLTSILNGVVERGTSVRAKVLGRPLAGKTGTTNDSYDTWFIGFTPDLVLGTYVGYDKPRTLGKKETGASVALPVFISFMKDALEGVPPKPFRVPPGIRLARIDRHTGQLADETTPPADVILEAFRSSSPEDATTYEPSEEQLQGMAGETEGGAADNGESSEPNVSNSEDDAEVARPINRDNNQHHKDYTPTVGTGGIY